MAERSWPTLHKVEDGYIRTWTVVLRGKTLFITQGRRGKEETTTSAVNHAYWKAVKIVERLWEEQLEKGYYRPNPN